MFSSASNLHAFLPLNPTAHMETRKFDDFGGQIVDVAMITILQYEAETSVENLAEYREMFFSF